MMKYIFITLLTLLTMQIAAAQEFKFSKDHDALLVKDLEKSAQFYAEVLGLKEIDNAGLGPKFRWFELENKVQIHLIESSEQFTPHKGVHLALNMDDLENYMQFLKKANVSFENWQGEKNTTNTRPDGVKQIYFTDPDGYWIEVNTNTL